MAHSAKKQSVLVGDSRRRWKTIQLPEKLLSRVDELIKRPELGYTSRSELVKEALRLRLEALETQILQYR